MWKRETDGYFVNEWAFIIRIGAFSIVIRLNWSPVMKIIVIVLSSLILLILLAISVRDISRRFLAPYIRYRSRCREKRKQNAVIHSPSGATPEVALDAGLSKWKSIFVDRSAAPDSGPDQDLREVVVHHLDTADTESALFRMFSVPEIRDTIVGYLHQLDVANLVAESAQVRVAIYADGNFSLEKVQPMTCDSGTKGKCWSCGLQICSSCRKTDNVGMPRTSRHFECEPLCSNCYYRLCCCDSFCSSFRHPPCCYCRDVVAPASKQPRDFCRRCGALPERSILQVLENREKEEMAHIAGSGAQCSIQDCKAILRGAGPLWWRCSKCKLECTKGYHPVWQSLSK